MSEHNYQNIYFSIKATGLGENDCYIFADKIVMDNDGISFFGSSYGNSGELDTLCSRLTKTFQLEYEGNGYDSNKIPWKKLVKKSLITRMKMSSRGFMNTVKEPHIRIRVENDRIAYLDIDVLHALEEDDPLALTAMNKLVADFNIFINKSGAEAKDFEYGLSPTRFAQPKNEVKDLYSKSELYGLHATHMDYKTNHLIFKDDDGHSYYREGDKYKRVS